MCGRLISQASTLLSLTHHYLSEHSSTKRTAAAPETSTRHTQQTPVVEERKKEKAPAIKDKNKDAGDLYQIEKPTLRDMPTTYDGVAEAEGELNLFDPRTNLFMSQADNVRCQLLRTADFTCKSLNLDAVVKCF